MKNMLAQLSTSNRYDKTGKIRQNEKQNSRCGRANYGSRASLNKVHPEKGRPSLYITDPQTTTHFNNMTPDELAINNFST